MSQSRASRRVADLANAPDPEIRLVGCARRMRSAEAGIAGVGGRLRDAAYDRSPAPAGGARGQEGRGGKEGLAIGHTDKANSTTNRKVGMRDDSPANCPCAMKWQIGQLSAEAWRVVPESRECPPFADDSRPDPCPNPGTSWRHGPQSVTAAWNAINEAIRTWRTIRDITNPKVF
jgi:hypothetical protein